jgi:dTDP-4-amino-4,6-dideoxygalactose transaminase
VEKHPLIPMNDFKRQWEMIGAHVLEAVARVGSSGFYILGQEVADFESKLAEFAGFHHAIGVASGQDALEISLRCLGIGSHHLVLTTPLSAFASTLAIIRVGATPVFCDTDVYGLLDLDICGEVLSKHKDSVGGMLPVNLFGHSINQERLDEIRKVYSVPVIQDCAQSIGAKWKGTGIRSEMAATSFYPTKNLGALGDGGAVFTDSDTLAERARCLRNYGQSGQYLHDHLGLNSRLDELQAAILADAMLPYLLPWEARRAEIAGRYCREIVNPEIFIPGAPTGSESVWHLFPILVDAAERENLRSFLSAQGIQTGIHYPKLIPEQRALVQSGRFQICGPLVNAQRYAMQEVSLPINPSLSDDAVTQIVSACNLWKRK